MHKILTRILLRICTVAGVLVLPLFLGTQLAGNIFKILSLIFFTSELTLIHFSIYLHRYLRSRCNTEEAFGLRRKEILTVITISIFSCLSVLLYILLPYGLSYFAIAAILILCIVQALGRLMNVMVDEIHYLIFGDAASLIVATIVCIFLKIESLDLFFICKSLATIPYIISCINRIGSRLPVKVFELMINWPAKYFEMYFLPVFITALAYPFLNWYIYSCLTPEGAVDLRLIQTLMGPIAILVSNTKSAYISMSEKSQPVRLAYILGVGYLFVTIPLFIVSLMFPPIELFGFNFGSKILLGFYILSVPAFFTLKYAEKIVMSTYSLHRMSLSMYQFVVAAILSMFVMNINIDALIASVVFAVYTLCVNCIIVSKG